jgi:hypothetical protein
VHPGAEPVPIPENSQSHLDKQNPSALALPPHHIALTLARSKRSTAPPLAHFGWKRLQHRAWSWAHDLAHPRSRRTAPSFYLPHWASTALFALPDSRVMMAAPLQSRPVTCEYTVTEIVRQSGSGSPMAVGLILARGRECLSIIHWAPDKVRAGNRPRMYEPEEIQYSTVWYTRLHCAAMRLPK